MVYPITKERLKNTEYSVTIRKFTDGNWGLEMCDERFEENSLTNTVSLETALHHMMGAFVRAEQARNPKLKDLEEPVASLE